jgi:hypothetical protein
VYHHLKTIKCPPLDKLNQLARITLSFGLEQELHDPKEQVRDAFIQHCKNTGFPDAGEWLWRKPTIATPLFKLVQILSSEKQAILTAYDADVDFDAIFKKGQFTYFSIPANNKPALKYVKNIMQSFYTNILCKGVDANVLNEREKLTRQTVLHSYIVEQQKNSMRVCPGCDGMPPEQESDGTIREDIDHFFPKSLYPFLTIHQLNLTPYCQQCNQTYKGGKDPLQVKNGQPTLALDDIFHPYIHAACDERKTPEVQVIVQRKKSSRPRVKILPSNTDSHHIARRNSLDNLLGLQIRWDGALRADNTTKPLYQYLRCIIRCEAQPFTPDAAWLLKKLPAIEQTIQDGIGESERHVAAHAYIKWLRTDAKAQTELLKKLPLYVSR